MGRNLARPSGCSVKFLSHRIQPSSHLKDATLLNRQIDAQRLRLRLASSRLFHCNAKLPDLRRKGGERAPTVRDVTSSLCQDDRGAAYAQQGRDTPQDSSTESSHNVLHDKVEPR